MLPLCNISRFVPIFTTLSRLGWGGAGRGTTTAIASRRSWPLSWTLVLGVYSHQPLFATHPLCLYPLLLLFVVLHAAQTQAKMIVSPGTGGEPEKDTSPTNKVRNSKKRSREESANPMMQQRLGGCCCRGYIELYIYIYVRRGNVRGGGSMGFEETLGRNRRGNWGGLCSRFARGVV